MEEIIKSNMKKIIRKTQHIGLLIDQTKSGASHHQRVDSDNATQTPEHWTGSQQQHQQHQNAQGKDDDSLNFTLLSQATHSVQQLQAQNQHSLLNSASKPPKLYQEESAEKKEHPMVQQSKDHVHSMHKEQQELKTLLYRQAQHNQQRVQDFVYAHGTAQLHDALQSLSKIDQYQAKSSGLPRIPKKKPPKVEKQIAQMRSQLHRDCSLDGRQAFSTPLTHLGAGFLTQKQKHKDDDLMFSIKKHKAVNQVRSEERLSQTQHKRRELQELQRSLEKQPQLKRKTPQIKDMDYVSVFLGATQEHTQLSRVQPIGASSEDVMEEINLILQASPLLEYMRSVQEPQLPDSTDADPFDSDHKNTDSRKVSYGIKSDMRSQAQVLDKVLEDVLTGKYYYGSSKMVGKMQLEDVRTGRLGKYLKGLDFKQVLLQSSKNAQTLSQASTERDLSQLPVDQALLDELFSIKQIKAFEKEILSALLRADDDSYLVTFLTQEYQPEEHYLQGRPEASVKTLTYELEEEKQHNARQKHLVAQNAQLRDKQLKSLLRRINQANAEIHQIPTQHSASSQQRGKQLLYLCFLELVRQVSQHCKEHGLLLVKLWHAYFDQVETQVQQLLMSIRQQTHYLQQNMEQLQVKVQTFAQQKQDKDNKFIDMKQNYEKTQQVLAIATKLLHREEDKLKYGQDQYEQLNSDLKNLFPRYQKYLKDQELQRQIKNASGTELPKNIDQKLYVEFNEKIDPYEEDLILDVERIIYGLNTKTPMMMQMESLTKQMQMHHKVLEEALKDKHELMQDFLSYKGEAKDRQGQLELHNYELSKEIDKLKLKLKKKQLKLNNFKRIYGQARFDQQTQTYITMGENKNPIAHKRGNSLANHNTMKMKQMETTKDLIEAYKAQPPLEKVYNPIKPILKVVRSGTSQYMNEAKTLRKTLSMISSIIQLKMQQMDTKNEKYALMNMDHFYYDFMNNKFGMDTLGKRYCEIFLVSMLKHKGADSRVDIFTKFIGLDRDKLPYAVFQAYVQLIKAANFSIQAIFTTNIQNLYIEHTQAKEQLMTVIPDSMPYVQTMLLAQLKDYSKIFSDNKKLNQGVDIHDYSLFKEFCDKLQQSKHRNINEFVATLYNVSHGTAVVSAEQLRDFIMKSFEFNLGAEGKTRVLSMIKTFFVDALDGNATHIPRDHLLQVTRMKFEMKVPLSAFFHIGLNAVIEHQNNENMWLESIYQFYSSIEIEPIQIELGQQFRQTQQITGLEFEQFVYFLQDSECKLPQNTVISTYRNTCEQNYRILMACDDFIEACLKYKLCGNKKTLEDNRKIRENKLKNMSHDQNSNKHTNREHGSESTFALKRKQSIIPPRPDILASFANSGDTSKQSINSSNNNGLKVSSFKKSQIQKGRNASSYVSNQQQKEQEAQNNDRRKIKSSKALSSQFKRNDNQAKDEHSFSEDSVNTDKNIQTHQPQQQQLYKSLKDPSPVNMLSLVRPEATFHSQLKRSDHSKHLFKSYISKLHLDFISTLSDEDQDSDATEQHQQNLLEPYQTLEHSEQHQRQEFNNNRLHLRLGDDLEPISEEEQKSRRLEQQNHRKLSSFGLIQQQKDAQQVSPNMFKSQTRIMSKLDEAQQSLNDRRQELQKGLQEQPLHLVNWKESDYSVRSQAIIEAQQRSQDSTWDMIGQKKDGAETPKARRRKIEKEEEEESSVSEVSQQPFEHSPMMKSKHTAGLTQNSFTSQRLFPLLPHSYLAGRESLTYSDASAS